MCLFPVDDAGAKSTYQCVDAWHDGAALTSGVMSNQVVVSNIRGCWVKQLQSHSGCLQQILSKVTMYLSATSPSVLLN